MSKGLEALEIIKETHQHLKLLSCGEMKSFEIVEKELKALEIIKENKINGLTLNWDGEWWTINVFDCQHPIAYGRKKEEYDLLKEVLLWNDIKDAQ